MASGVVVQGETSLANVDPKVANLADGRLMAIERKLEEVETTVAVIRDERRRTEESIRRLVLMAENQRAAMKEMRSALAELLDVSQRRTVTSEDAS